MAKKVEKNVKKPAKTSQKVEKKPVKQASKTETKTIKKTEVNNAVKRETKLVKKTDVDNASKRETKVIKKPPEKAVTKLSKRIKPKKEREAKFEEKKDIDKLYVYFTIVNAGVAESVVKVFEDMGCSVSFIQNGVGTASEEVKKALHIQDSRKEVVISIIRESRLEDVEKELAAFFLASKRNKGVAFATKMDAIQGVRLYKFLSQTL